jgi:outer membrane lipoprotein-sorting protein
MRSEIYPMLSLIKRHNVTMVKNPWCIFLTIIMVTGMTLSVPGQDLEPITGSQLNQLLVDAEQNFAEIKTIKTMFSQEKSLSIFTEPVISKGFCLFKAPDQIRLEYTEPFKSSLIVNHDQIYKYEFYAGQWKKLDSADKEIMLTVMDNIGSWLKGKFKDPKVYDISAMNGDNKTIFLVPKHDAFKKFIQSFELGLNHQMNGLDYIIIHENEKDYTKINFHNDVVNEDISDTVFRGEEDGPQPVAQW